MFNVKKIKSFIALILVILQVLVLSSCWTKTDKLYQLINDSRLNGELVIQFLDVGQADSALIFLPDGKMIMIDAGNEEDSQKIVSYLFDMKVQYIDFLIGTHPHEDHIGGLDAVIDNVRVDKLILPKTHKKSFPAFSSVVPPATQ